MIASRETVLSLAYRIGTIGLSFASVSLLIRVLGADRYGAWATLVSGLVWIQMSDLGIGYVIKNRVAARENQEVLLGHIADAFRLSLAIGLALAILLVWVGPLLSIVRDFPLESAVLYGAALLCLPAMVAVNVLQGLGQSTVPFMATMLQNLAWLVFVYSAEPGTSIQSLSIVMALLWTLSAAYVCFRAWCGLKFNPRMFVTRLVRRPCWIEARPLLQVGLSFFLLQMTGLVLFNLGTYLAYTWFSADAAARYDILNKIFLVPITLFNVVIAVAWSAIASGISQRNHAAVHRVQMNLLITCCAGGALLLGVAMVAVPPFIRLYSHGAVNATSSDVFWFAALAAVQMFAYSGAVFMNAVERLRIQIAFAAVSMTAFVPLFFALAGTELGIASIPLATLIAILPGAVFFNYYARRHIVSAVAQ